MSNVQIMDHPLIQHKINYIRSEDVGSKEFREIVSEIASLMCEMTGKKLSGKKIAVVPILRAGLGMVDGILKMIPAAKVGHIGLYRDPETFKPVEYYCKLPADCDEREVFVVDPMSISAHWMKGLTAMAISSRGLGMPATVYSGQSKIDQKRAVVNYSSFQTSTTSKSVVISSTIRLLSTCMTSLLFLSIGTKAANNSRHKNTGRNRLLFITVDLTVGRAVSGMYRWDGTFLTI